ncbi:secretory phospholipase A2 receptor-like isoform X2 [Argopecten irradians]
MIHLAILLILGFTGTAGSTTVEPIQISMSTRDLMVMESTDFTINCTTGGLATKLLSEPMEFTFTPQESSDATPGNKVFISENNDLNPGIDNKKYEVSFSAQTDFSFYLVIKAASLQDTGMYTCSRGGKNVSTFVEVRSKQDIICTCADGYIRYGNACFRFYHQKLSWPEASYMCEAFGSSLAYIESMAEYDFIRGFVTETQGGSNDEGFWLGATSALLPGHWHWKSDLSVVDFDVMDPLVSNEPNYDCLYLSGDYNYSPRGSQCGDRRNFICKTKVSKCI